VFSENDTCRPPRFNIKIGYYITIVKNSELTGEGMTDGQIVDLYFARNEDAISDTSYKYGERLKIVLEDEDIFTADL